MSGVKDWARGCDATETAAMRTATQILAIAHQPGVAQAGCKLLVRKIGFEPTRPCGRQPLKLVRLPVPPLPRRTRIDDYFGGVAGACTGAAGPRTPLNTEPL